MGAVNSRGAEVGESDDVGCAVAVGSVMGGSTGYLVEGVLSFARTGVVIRLATTEGTKDGTKEGSNLYTFGGWTDGSIVG